MDITQRIYRGKVDTPKTFNSRRWAGLGTGLSTWIREWVEMIPEVGPEAWIFPSEKATTPLPEGQLLEAQFPAPSPDGKSSMGKFPGHAQNAFLPLGRVGN